MDFIVYDLIFLALFLIFVSVFLYIRRKKVVREGLMFLYKTQVGVKIIDKLSKKGKRFWKILAYPIVAIGYFLMAMIVFVFVKGVYEYIFNPNIIEFIKAPPIMILVPYFTRLFGVQDFFPGEFYFAYFIAAIIVIAVVHEGAHGVYARLHDVRIKSTGWGFLGPFLAFFVEQDDKDMNKKKIFPQLSILAAGVFANLVAALVFFGILVLLFNNAYVPYGVEINSYTFQDLPISDVLNPIITNQTIEINQIELTKIIVNEKGYLVTSDFFKIDLETLDQEVYVRLYQDQPAIRNNLKGTIIKINENPIASIEKLSLELGKNIIGQEITVTTDFNGEIKDYEIELGEDYITEEKPVLGVIIGPQNNYRIFSMIEGFRDYGIDYRPKSNPDATLFFYNLLAWIVFINILVAFFNMLPVAIFDGGRFFYLTVLGITKNKKIAEKSFRIITSFILLLIIALMVAWAIKRYL